MLATSLSIIAAVVLAILLAVFIFNQYKKTLREAKNYERGLKMVPMYIHIPPSSDDIESNGRDERDITEEVISQAQVMYNIISSTATKGLKSKLYGQRHLSFELMAQGGLIHYYVVVPVVLVDVIKQAVAASYPAARLEEVEEHNIFSQVGKIDGVSGGEFTLRKDYFYPIATYQETKRDASRAILNALASVGREDGAAIQILMRPAYDGWTKESVSASGKIKKDKGKNSSLVGSVSFKDFASALWQPPESSDPKPEDKQLNSLEQKIVESIEEKTRYPGYETLIRVVVSSSNSIKSQAMLKNIVAAFSMFDSTTSNGFKFSPAKDVNDLVTAYIFRFFPQTVNQNILNTVELATIFHLPNKTAISSSQVQRQAARQVDGPHELLEEGFFLGYNEFRGVKKEIRLSTNDRRRHTYIIGQTGTGKSVLLENLAYQDMMDGKGFAFVDPHGDSVEKLLGMVPKERVEDVIYFDPGDLENPMGLNLFEYDTPEQMDFLIQETLAMLYRLYDPGHTGIIGPRFETWFRNAALTIMSDPGGSSFVDVQQVFIDQAFADEKLKHVKNRVVLDFWNKEMAQTSEATKSEMLGWFTSKFGAFLSNDMMRNIIGQTKSSFNLRDIMDNKKILLVNLSKGRTGELNSQLLGMIFVTKFQVAAMSRASIPESEREDFSLYVDEFQNFATDSFESILSEARKYRLNLILANQFLTQLTEKIQEAIKGNIGTIISGRIGVTDAEILEKKFTPVFDAEDLTKLPNYQTVASVMVNGMPSSAFSMSLVPSMGQSNPQLRDALKRLSTAKYGRDSKQVEREIFTRLGIGDEARKGKMEALKKAQTERLRAMGAGETPGYGGMPQVGPFGPAHTPQGYGRQQMPSQTTQSSFLDEWLARRSSNSNPANHQAAASTNPRHVAPFKPADAPKIDTDKLHIRSSDDDKPSDDEVSIKLR